jgi:hypothetical protein
MKKTPKKLAVNPERIRVLSELPLVRGGVLPTSNVTCLSHEQTECCPPN